MNNPSGVTHDQSIPGKSLLKEQMAIMNDLKELLTDKSKNDKKAFIVCHSEESIDGRHDYHPVTEKTIKAPLKSSKDYVMVSHYKFNGYMHYYERCTKCQKMRMGCYKI